MVATDYVGLDPSYIGFGAALIRPDGSHKTWLGKFDAKKHETKTERLYRIMDWLESQVFCEAVAGNIMIGREGYAPGVRFGREMSGELGAAVNMAIYDSYYRDPIIVGTTALKKFVTGSGSNKVQKNQMLMHTYRKWHVEFSNDNECDAYGIAKVMQALDAAPGTLLGYEAEVVKVVKEKNPPL